MNRFSKFFVCILLVIASSFNASCYAREVAIDTRLTAEVSWQPHDTLVMMAGVLTWQDTSLATYTASNRYDQKLYGILRQRGVPAENIVFLKDKKATLAAIRRSLQKLLAGSNERSTFMFYYTGHGEKSADGSDTYFLNYDCDTNSLDTTSFSLSEMAKTIKSSFKGKMVILTADCCYSGNLNRVADTLGAAGIDTLVLSSATAANESTGEWTVTKSLNEILNGTPLMKFDELKLPAASAADYIAYNMACAEMQLSNYYLTQKFSARVLKREGNFHYIRYDDHEEVWNEWVAFDRIRDRS